jgi:hypothetical protein
LFVVVVVVVDSSKEKGTVMFRFILYVRPSHHKTGEKAFGMKSEVMATWEEANRIMQGFYTTKSKDTQWEVCGGTIEQKIEGIGWVVCEEPPEEEFDPDADSFSVVLGPRAAWE